ncbi:hypothetical protein M3650_15210 [Paenibacillus sp. MER TA 81-3]|uniref:hypothetical protein n=1 Tax=Paenibacillus sp. MER TA 81-3 TaxID=2939573 RepID=UPI00203ED11F|nr:hypothetical protein [Paenibacillus sp. MER TA 81-3]MCM3339943.1 hypothetical protein [Paenibacillus sp. MER TA 81-3]
MLLEHYIGRAIEIIYEDRHGDITKRRVIIHKISDGTVHATCLRSSGWRPFKMERILSWQPIREGRTA